MKAYENLMVDREPGLAVITINRPRVLNALGTETMFELGEALDGLAADDRREGVSAFLEKKGR